jgi:ribulose-phosphate 3-epimerase
MSRLRVAPSLLSADFSDLRSEIEAVERAGVDILHLDVMDGHFVPNLTFGPMIVKAIRKLAKSDLDVHLMITHPGTYLRQFVDAGADYVTFHVEAVEDQVSLLEQTRALGVKGGISIKPATLLEAARPAFEMADLVMIMTVDPGFGGQAFMSEVVPKLRQLYELKRDRGYGFEIEVDGGVNVETVKTAAWAGADVLVAGAAIFRTDDPAAAVRRIGEAAAEGLARREEPDAFPLAPS